jgi:hypothetical protein
LHQNGCGMEFSVPHFFSNFESNCLNEALSNLCFSVKLKLIPVLTKLPFNPLPELFNPFTGYNEVIFFLMWHFEF